MTNIKFFLLPYKERTCWSNKDKKHYFSDTIDNQVWEDENVPLKGLNITLPEIIDYIKSNPSDCKQHRHVLLRFDTDRYPVKNYTDISKSSFVIFIDIDDHDEKTLLHNLTADKFNQMYDTLYDVLSNDFAHNFLFMEKSSNGHGIHLLFYYDVPENEKTLEKFRMCAEYTKHIFFDEIEKYIKGFSKIICENGVFDVIYNRPYQKSYLTCFDCKYNEYCDGLLPVDIENYKAGKITQDKSNYEISEVKIDGKWDVDHNDRFKIYTAIKRVTKNEKECNKIWEDLCKHFNLYKNYTYDIFCSEFNYDSIDETKARVSILSEYGIIIDRSTQHYYLDNDKYLGDIRDNIINNITEGITMLQAGTGVGKTRCWTDLNKKILSDILEIPYHKPILVIEPLNSIINTKYNDDVKTVTGSTQFPKKLDSYAMYVTNYNKLLRKTYDGHFELRDDLVEFFSQFELIVIDESHIIIKDSFRCEVLIPFIDTIKEASKNSKIIIQTATPMEEERLFDIQNKIIVHKYNDTEYKLLYRKYYADKFYIQSVNSMVTYYHDAGRKVYIYWNNGSLRQMKELQYALDNRVKVAVYHKRNSGSPDMEYINENHGLFDEYDVLISSVYFGVGNDLDDPDDAAVIIIGNNTWQEDVQAIGRWRNSKDIEVSQIIIPGEEFDPDEYYEYENLLKDERRKLWKLWKDKLNKDKSVIINKKAFQITKVDDIEKLAVMKASCIYNSLAKVKVMKIKGTYDHICIKTNYDEPLIVNEDFTECNKRYWKEVREIRDQTKLDIINGNIDYDVINSDSKLSRWYTLYKKLQTYELVNELGPKTICANSKYNMLNIFCSYYKQFLNGMDLSELYALLWYRENYNEDKLIYIKDNILTIKDNDNQETEDKIDNKTWFSMCAYILFLKNKNLYDKNYNVKSFYFKTFKWYCDLFHKMPDCLIQRFLNKQSKDEQEINTMMFFDKQEDEWEIDFSEDIHSLADIKNYIETNTNYTEENVQWVMSVCLDTDNTIIKEVRKNAGKKGSPKKICKITEKINESRINLIEKYNLTVGQEFDSCYHLAKYVNRSNKTISKWRENGWII